MANSHQLWISFFPGKMTLADDVDLEEYVMSKVRTNHKLQLKNRLTWYAVQHDLVKQSAQDELSGADIKAICTEAGLLALRERRMKVSFLTSCLYQGHLTSWILSSLLSLNRLSARIPLIGDTGGLQEVEGECALQEAGGNPRGTVHVDHCCVFALWREYVENLKLLEHICS